MPEFSNVGKTYLDFKLAVLSMYPAVSEDRHFAITDLDRLIGETTRIGIHSLADLADFYWKFFSITTFLISKNQLSEQEQSNSFLRGFQPSLLAAIENCLQLKLPDHDRDDHYKLSDIKAAAEYVLHGMLSTLCSDFPVSPSVNSSPQLPSGIKAEDLTSLAEAISRSLTQVLGPTLAGIQAARPRLPMGSNCHYCGEPGCMISTCPKVEEDT